MLSDGSVQHGEWPRLALLLVGLFILLNLALALLLVFNKPFNPDELQHLHIAWSIANGEVLYRDFWEHHGPLYSLMNGALIFLADPAPTVRLIFASRLLSLVAGMATLAVLWRMVRKLQLSGTTAWLAVAFCSGFYFFVNKSGEMRPDALQALFWLSGVYFLVVNAFERSFKWPFLAGALFALAIMANAKAGIGPFFVVVYYLTARWTAGLSWTDIGRDMAALVVGGLAALAPFLIYFAANGALVDLFYFNYVWNFLLNYHWSTIWGGKLHGEEAGVSLRNWYFFVDNQWPMLVLGVAGIVAWLTALLQPSSHLSRPAGWLILVAGSGSSLGWMLNQHSQYFLMFLPFWALLAAYVLTQLASWSGAGAAGRWVSAALAIVAAAVVLNYSVRQTPFSEAEMLTNQKATSAFVRMTSRDEPVGILWNQCGGYMFNPHVGFYWVAMPYISEVIEAIDGEHPFDQAYIDRLETENVRYVIGMEEWMVEGLSDKALAYLRANFDYSPCLWTRKQ